MSLFTYMSGLKNSPILHPVNSANKPFEKNDCNKTKKIKGIKNPVNVSDYLYGLLYDYNREYSVWFSIAYNSDNLYKVHGTDMLKLLAKCVPLYIDHYMFIKGEVEDVKKDNQFLYQFFSPHFKLTTNKFISMFVDDCKTLAEKHNFELTGEMIKELKGLIQMQ